MECLQESVGDILVFLTGQDDIDAAVQMLVEEARDKTSRFSGKFVLFSFLSGDFFLKKV